MLQYFKANELGYGTDIFIRHETKAEAEKILQRYKQARPKPEVGPLEKVSWWEGRKTFSNIPANHDVIWPVFDTEMGRFSGKSDELVVGQCS
jgi:hypothetical protein